MPTPVLDLTSPALNAKAPDSLARQGSTKLGKDEFLKLLVAQLANQDPTEPQETSAFVAQLAQFSALEQQQHAVQRLDTLLLGQATANQTSAAAFIGKDVSYRSDKLQFDGMLPASATVSLAKQADKVTVSVTDANGRTVRTLQLGAHQQGPLAVAWDGRDDAGNLVKAGEYKVQAAAFDADGKAVSVDLSATGHVAGVAFEGGVPMLKVDGSLVKMSDITSINERKSP